MHYTHMYLEELFVQTVNPESGFYAEGPFFTIFPTKLEYRASSDQSGDSLSQTRLHSEDQFTNTLEGNEMNCQDVKPNIHSISNGNSEDRHNERTSNGVTITDEIRFSIIEAIQLRPCIWDNSSKEARSHLSRKDNFMEVAQHLNSLGHPLSTLDVEKQWKNLKDTYNKVKKKLILDQHGNMVPPKWRFFSAMLFLDQADNYQTTQQQQMNNIMLTTPTDSRKRRHNMESPSLSLQKMSKTDMLGQLPCSEIDMQPMSHEDLSVPSSSTTPQAIRCTIPIATNLYKTHNTDNSTTTTATPRGGYTNHHQSLHHSQFFASNAVLDDEYSSFCRSLVFSLREIGSTNRLQYLKVQKAIRDTIHEAQVQCIMSGGQQCNNKMSSNPNNQGYK
uniref:MADF domain-containing protein n=3 Tax=Strongyloides stercoralis TaxID=6248 RepID=A0AAF5DBK4_STRER